MTSKKKAQTFHTDDPDLGSAFKARSGWRRVISMEFLHFVLRRHFAGKAVVASGNSGCFLRLPLASWLLNGPAHARLSGSCRTLLVSIVENAISLYAGRTKKSWSFRLEYTCVSVKGERV